MISLLNAKPIRELYIAILAIVFAFAVLGDLAFAVTLSERFLWNVTEVAALLTLPRLWSMSRRHDVGLFLIFCIGLGLLRFVEFSPVKPFTRFHQTLHPGMSNAQVQQQLNLFFSQGGRFKRPTQEMERVAVDAAYFTGYGLSVEPQQIGSTHLQLFTLDPDDADYNAECISIFYKEGKVTATEYLPD